MAPVGTRTRLDWSRANIWLRLEVELLGRVFFCGFYVVPGAKVRVNGCFSPSPMMSAVTELAAS